MVELKRSCKTLELETGNSAFFRGKKQIPRQTENPANQRRGVKIRVPRNTAGPAQVFGLPHNFSICLMPACALVDIE